MKENKVVIKTIITIIISLIMFIVGFITFNIIYVKDENRNIIKAFEKQSEKIAMQYDNVGKIRIEKISIEYPILTDTSDEALRTSVVKLYGSNPGENGNLCIMGSNTKNNEFFSNLVKLEIADEIIIKDKNNNEVKYAIYDIYTTTLVDSEYTSQKTGGKKEVTLITDTTKGDKRIIVKAREV